MGQKLEWTWPWSALAAPHSCGVMIPRGSGGREKRQKKGAKGTGFPTGDCKALGATPSPSPGPILLVMQSSGCSLGTFSFFFQLWNCPCFWGWPLQCTVGAAAILLPWDAGQWQ